MRVLPKCGICDLAKSYTDIAYQDSRCKVLKHDGGLICIFNEHTTKVSKRQREWMEYVLKKVSKNEKWFGTEKPIIEVAQRTEHYHVFALSDAKKTNTKRTKKESN